MEETATGSENEQIPEEGGEDETGVILPDEPTPELVPDAPVQDPAPEAPVGEDVDAPTEEEPIVDEEPVEEEPIVDEEPADEEPADEEPAEEADPMDSYDINNVEIMVDEPAAAKVTITFDKFDAIRQNVKIEASTATPDDYKTIRKAGLVVNKNATVKIKLTPVAGFAIDTVKAGTAEQTGTADGTAKVYTVTPDKNVTLTITAYPVYVVTLKDGTADKATNLGIKIEDSLKDAVVGEGDAKLMVAADGTAKVKSAADKDFSFTLNGTPAADTKAIVSYSTEADGSKTVIAPKEVEKKEGTETAKVNVYTVDKAVIANLDGALFIHLEKETASTVTAGTGAAAGNNADVDITVPGTDDAYVALDAPNGKKFIGDTFKFKVALKNAVKDTKEITEVAIKAAGDAEATPLKAENDVYSFEVKGDTTITVTTAYVNAASHLFKFTLAEGSAAGSAEAVVKNIVVTKDNTDTTYVASGSDPNKDIATYPNMPTGQKLTAGEVLRLPNAVTEGTIKSITFTVTPVTTKGYELAPLNADDTSLTTRDITFVAGTAADGETKLAEGGKENAITVGTQVKKSAGEVFFLPSTSDENLTINVPNGAGTKVEQIMNNDVTPAVPKAYKIAANEATATFTVTAKAGNTLVKTSLTEVSGVGSITEKTEANGDITYTVTLFTSLITGTTEAAPKAYTLTSEESHFKAVMESPVEANTSDYSSLFEITSRKFTAPATTEAPNPAATDVDNTENTNKGNIVYGSKLEIVITGKNGHTITGLTYTMGDVAGTIAPKIEEVMVAGTPASRATLTIPKVTGNVLFSVTTDESVYKLTKLQVLGADGTTASDVDPADYIEEDDRYLVNHEKSYLVNIQKDGTALLKADAKDLTAAVTAVKDGKTTTVRQSRKEFASGGLVIDLANKGLAGAEVKIEVSYKGEKVGTYNLTVSKETSEISVNDGKVIEQQVDSVATYAVKTDGVLSDEIEWTTANGIIDDVSLDVDNKILTITTKPVAADALKTGDTVKKDTVTIKAADNTDVECVVEVAGTAFFDKAKTVTVDETANATADTVIGVTLTPGEVLKAGYKALEAGSLWYEVTVTPAEKKSDAADAPAFSTVSSKMKSAFTEYYEVKGASQREEIVVGQSAYLGTGEEWPYTISTKLVYLGSQPADSAGAAAAVASVKEKTDTAKDAKISTKKPTFTAALKLQKVSKKEGGVTEVYTGQSGEMIIAQPTFKDKGFAANYQVVESGISDSSYGLTFGVNAKGQIVVTNVDKNAAIGKHTITVTATADETPGHEMYASKATTTVNVVKGINGIQITQPGTVIYAGDPKKVASMKLGVKYNEASGNDPDYWYDWSYDLKGKKITNPKKKTLEWSVVARESGKEVPVSETIEKYVTVDKKNGTIKVAKGFTPSSHAAENRFYVKAVAKDFDGNPAVAYSNEFTVAAEKLEIGTLALYKIEGSKYNVIKVDSSAWNKKTPVEVTPEEVDNSWLALFPVGVTVEEKTYSETAWNKLGELNHKDFTYKSSAAKVVGFRENGSFSVLGAKKKVTITVTANDGGKKKNSIVLNLGYDDISAPRLHIVAANDAGEWNVPVCTAADAPDANNKVAKNIENVTGTARLHVQVMTKGEGDTYVAASDNANYKLTVKGGSFDKVNNNTNGTKLINTASKTVTLTLTDNTTKPKKTVYTYVLTNKAYDLAVKAPKVKVTGSLYAYATDAEQNVKLNVKNADGTPAAYAKVEVDWTSRTTKNSWMLNRLDSKMKSNTENKHIFKLNDNETLGEKGDVALTFEDLCDGYVLTTGSYKLKVTVVNASGKEQGLPATATLKVVKRPKFTFKPTTSYTISKADGGVMLTGKSSVKNGARANVNWYSLKNANVKGVSNNFTKFFTLAYDADTKTTMLKATDLFWAAVDGKTTIGEGQSAIQVPTLDKKNDLTGYVYCSAYADKAFYEGTYSGYVKLTIKLPKDLTKPAAKYAVNKPDVLLSGADAKTAVNVKIGNEFVKIGYAVPNSAKPASKELELVNDGTKLGVNAKGQVEVKVKSGVTLTEKKTYSIEIKALPANSVYAKAIAAGGAGRAIAVNSLDDMYSMSANTPAEQEPTTPEGIVQKYGVPVKITVRGMSKPVNVTPDPVIPVPPVEKEDIPDAVATAVEAVTLTAVDFTGTWVDAPTSLSSEKKTAVLADATTKVNAALTGGGYSAYSIKTLTAADIVDGRANAQSAEGGVKVTLTRDDYNDRVVTIYFSVNITAGDDETVTVTISGGTNCTVTWAAAASGTTPSQFEAVSGSTISVTSGQDLYLKVEPEDGYEVAVTKGNDDTPVSETTSGSKTYKIENVTEATTVTITATQTQQGGSGTP